MQNCLLSPNQVQLHSPRPIPTQMIFSLTIYELHSYSCNFQVTVVNHMTSLFLRTFEPWPSSQIPGYIIWLIVKWTFLTYFKYFTIISLIYKSTRFCHVESGHKRHLCKGQIQSRCQRNRIGIVPSPAWLLWQGIY